MIAIQLTWFVDFPFPDDSNRTTLVNSGVALFKFMFSIKRTITAAQDTSIDFNLGTSS